MGSIVRDLVGISQVEESFHYDLVVSSSVCVNEAVSVSIHRETGTNK